MHEKRAMVVVAILLALALVFACAEEEKEKSSGGPTVVTDGDQADADDDPPLHRDKLLGQSVDETFLVEALENDVAVAWGEYGIPHIYAMNDHDAMMALGYVSADTRMMEMEFIRKLARGRLTDLIGARLGLEEVDLFYRMIFSKKDGGNLLEEIGNSLSQETLDLVEAYGEGINLRLERYREDDSDWPEPFSFFLINQSPDQTDDWELADTLAIMRLQEWNLARSLDYELEMTEMFELFDEETFNALIFAEPTVPISIMPQAGERKAGKQASRIFGKKRGKNFLKMVMAAREKLGRIKKWDAISDKGASNNWAVAPKDGISYVCNDPHLQLSSPAIFLPVTLDTIEMPGAADGMRLAGVAFPGLPSVIIGRNERIAWAETTTNFDVCDIYEETVTFNGDGEPVSVLFEGSDVPVNKVIHRFRNGHGDDPDYIELPLYFVPHHGPLLPETLDPENSKALSFRWTGLEVTNEIKAILALQKTKTADEVYTALNDFDVGAQNFTFGSVDGDIGWYPHGLLPIRSDDPGKLAEYPPWMVMPGGTGEYEWTGYIPDDIFPRMKNPEEGYIVTANNDPTGSTFDNDPLNDDYYYLNNADTGFRAYTADKGVKTLIDAGDYDWEDMLALQFSYVSEFAVMFAPVILDLADRCNLNGDLTAAALTALDLLRNWDDYKMPSGLADDSDPAGSAPHSDSALRAKSAATTYFNHLVIRLGHEILHDDLQTFTDPYGNPYNSLPWNHDAKAVAKILIDLHQNEIESPFWDNVETVEAETPADILKLAVEKAVDDVLAHGEFAGLGVDEAMWGRIHTLTMENNLSMMTSTYNVAPYGLGGGMHTLNVAGFGYSLNPDGKGYTFGHGASLRMVHEITSGGITTHFHLPGGVDENMDSGHFLDLFHLWRTGESMILTGEWSEVKAAGIERMTALVPAP